MRSVERKIPMLYYEFYEFELGPLTIGDTDGAVSTICFGRVPLKEGVQKETDITLKTAKEIDEYLAGERTAFDLPLRPEGTHFQKKVWEALLTIPYGETRSYKEIAILAGSPKGFRAVGMANNRNPIPILIPCHRVIGSDGSMTGYGGGLPIKIKLLETERGGK